MSYRKLESARVLITSDAALRNVLPELLRAEVVGLDTETTGLDPRSHRPRLVQLAIPGRVYVVDCFRLEPVMHFGAGRCVPFGYGRDPSGAEAVPE